MDNHIVYIGRLNGEVVYVGEGKPGRHEHLNSGTSHVYEANKVHFSGEFIEVEIFKDNLTKQESLRIEKELIQKLQPTWNRTLTFKSEISRKITKLLSDKEHLMRSSNKLALLYACKDKISSDGTAAIHRSEVDNVGGNFKKLQVIFNKKKKADKMFDMEQIRIGHYLVKFNMDWLNQLEINMNELIIKAKRRNNDSCN